MVVAHDIARHLADLEHIKSNTHCPTNLAPQHSASLTIDQDRLFVVINPAQPPLFFQQCR